MAEFQRAGAALPTIPRPQSGSGGKPSLPALRESGGMLARLAEAEDRTQPASDAELAREIDGLVDFIQTFGLPMTSVGKLTDFYTENLKDLPADLLAMAIRDTIRTHKYHTLPKPGDIRQHVEESLMHRKTMSRSWRRDAERAGLLPPPSSTLAISPPSSTGGGREDD